MSTITSCYPGELHQGHQYYLFSGQVRIPVYVPPGLRNGEYSSATVSGHSVWFWVGVPAHCGGGGISLAAVGILAAIGLILFALVISGLRRRHARACDHPVHTHRT